MAAPRPTWRSHRSRPRPLLCIVGQSADAMKAAAKMLLATSDRTLQRAARCRGSNEASSNVEAAAAAAADCWSRSRKSADRPMRWYARPPQQQAANKDIAACWRMWRKRSATWSSSSDAGQTNLLALRCYDRGSTCRRSRAWLRGAAREIARCAEPPRQPRDHPRSFRCRNPSSEAVSAIREITQYGGRSSYTNAVAVSVKTAAARRHRCRG